MLLLHTIKRALNSKPFASTGTSNHASNLVHEARGPLSAWRAPRAALSNT